MWFKPSFTTPAVVAISFCLFGSTTPTYADLGDQLAKLLADDGSWGDRFGHAVAISGTTVVIGAYFDNDNGPDSGSAYLFDAIKDQQIAKLLPSDGAEFDNFGESVAISGITVIIGTSKNDDNGEQSGSAYLFDTTKGQQLFKLLPNDGAALDQFGLSVAISGNTAIVGARGDTDNGLGSGSAYLFDTNTGQQIAKLLPIDGAAFDQFGISVGISDPTGMETAIVGAWLDKDNGNSSGSAYLFDTNTGQQIAKLLANDGAAFDLFGFSVAISDGTAIVGAHQDDDNGPDSGSAYLFDTTTGKQLAKLLADDGAEFDNFGISVAISGTTAIVGAFLGDDKHIESGSAYLFDISNPTNPVQIFKLLATDGTEGDSFGNSVAISGITALVGAELDYNGGLITGSAYLFDANKCRWDMNGDGFMGAGDLLILFGWWGSDPGGPPDFDGDGIVSTSDLLQLLINWGPCP